MFEQLKTEYDAWVKGEYITLFERQTRLRTFRCTAVDQPRQEITITLPDGTGKKGTSWETSPMDIAKEISKGLAERIVIAKVNGELWDLERPLEGSVSLELLDFEHPDGPVFPCPSALASYGSWESRKACVLAFIGARPWRIRGEALRMPFVHWASH